MNRINTIAAAITFMALTNTAHGQIDYASTYIQAPLWDSINASDPIMTEDFSSDAIYDRNAPVAAPQSLDFTPNAAQRKKNVADYIARVAKIEKDYAPKLAAELADGSVFKRYEQMLSRLGLDPNSLADHFAAWWITAWEASKLTPVETLPAAFPNVKVQVDRILSKQSFGTMSSKQKQMFADSLMIQTLVLANQIDQAKASPEVARQLSTGIKAGAAKFGLDLGSMSLTGDGFVPVTRKRSDAGDAVPDGNGWSSGKLVLIAVAGIADPGGVFFIGKAMGNRGR